MKSKGYEDILLRVPSLQKLHKMVSYRPKYNLQNGLKKYLNLLNKRWKIIRIFIMKTLYRPKDINNVTKSLKSFLVKDHN